MRRAFIILLLLAPLEVYAQAPTYPLNEDVSTLDGIIKAYYEVVSAEAGEARDWARDSSLHAVDARVVVTGKRVDGTPYANILTLAQYHANSGDVAKQGFFEEEIHRETQRFGNIAHVWSTYAWRRTVDGPVEGRGINSIQLFHDGTRWWINSWFFDSEREDTPIPQAYLPE